MSFPRKRESSVVNNFIRVFNWRFPDNQKIDFQEEDFLLMYYRIYGVLLAGELNRQVGVALHERRERAVGFVLDGDSFEPLEDLFPENPQLELGETAAHAEDPGYTNSKCPESSRSTRLQSSPWFMAEA